MSAWWKFWLWWLRLWWPKPPEEVPPRAGDWLVRLGKTYRWNGQDWVDTPLGSPAQASTGGEATGQGQEESQHD